MKKELIMFLFTFALATLSRGFLLYAGLPINMWTGDFKLFSVLIYIGIWTLSYLGVRKGVNKISGET